MKPRFEPDREPAPSPPPKATLVDPEADDASEQRFAASLEEAPARPKFAVEEAAEALGNLQSRDVAPPAGENCAQSAVRLAEPRETLSKPQVADAWRQEVQAKISHYRARKRPSPPRYPSLQLKFESSSSSWSNNAVAVQHTVIDPPRRDALETEHLTSEATVQSAESSEVDSPDYSSSQESSGNLLEFPHVLDPPAIRDELAEAVLDHLRIVEAPEVLPPPPALGGILIESTKEEVKERRPGFDLPLQAASMPRRLLALVVDGLLVILSGVLFSYIYFRMTSNLPPLRQIVLVSAGVMAFFWVGYQYLLLVYTGSTPGLKLAKLRLSQFDGRPVPRRLRRWRVLASVLSGLSLALGYAWCLFDEDQLCWHDRITHTYMAPEALK
jgi:uncharacterized RDD family membrane protein YckC